MFLRLTCGCGRITDYPFTLLLQRKGVSRNTFLGNVPFRCQKCNSTTPAITSIPRAKPPDISSRRDRHGEDRVMHIKTKRGWLLCWRNIDMELPGSAYLFSMAMIAITFAGFTAIFVMLRQTRGAAFTTYDLFVTRNYMMVSFLIVLGSLLPSLLAAVWEPDSRVWQFASASVAILMTMYVLSFPRRRRAATDLPRPSALWVQEIIFSLAIIILVANALGTPRVPDFAFFEIGMTLSLCGLFYSFLVALSVKGDWPPSLPARGPIPRTALHRPPTTPFTVLPSPFNGTEAHSRSIPE